jgi:lipoic acid synthetase
VHQGSVSLIEGDDWSVLIHRQVFSVMVYDTFPIIHEQATQFCNLKRGNPEPVDPEEPYRLLEAVKTLNLRYVVITSPTRDDLEDGGAGQFAKCIRVLKENIQNIKVEVLVPDFGGSHQALKTVLLAEPMC